MKEMKYNPLNIIRRFTVYLVERFRPFNGRAFQNIVGIVTIVVLATVLILGWMSLKKVKDVVTEDFNQQQLVLARHAARQVENKLNVLKKELTLLGLSPSVQYFEQVSIGKRMGITFLSVKDEGTLEIRYVESARLRTYVVNAHGYRIVQPHPEDIRFLSRARESQTKGAIQMTDAFPNPRFPSPAAGMEESLIMKIAIPVWQVSVDESHPVATREFSGVLIFLLDATALVEKIVKDIRSGKTGYAWAIDYKGTFLFHPETEFIGKNAFEARKEKRPSISFGRINEIQKDMMLVGKEGTSWYISGWHRGREEEMKKLIAYAPIHLGSKAENRIWSVAVVAPISEVESAIHAIQIRQFLLEGVIILTIFFGGLLLLGIMLKWSSSLKQEVEEKTKELKKSDSQCRSLVENAGDIIYTVDEHGSFLSMNRYGHQFFTRNPSDTLGRNIASLFPDESALSQMLTIQEVFKTNSSRQVTSPVTVDGNEYWLSTNFSGLQDENGSVYAVLGIARDITERKKMEEQMFYTEKLASIGTLAAGVAHEINNPLAIILGFADMLAEKTPPSSEAYDMIKTIEKHGTNAKRVVENLLSFTRLAEHKEEDVDINKNIEAVLAVLGNTLSLHKITVSRSLSKSLALVKGDAGELQQVLFNIVNNAVHAVKGDGIITISTKPVEEGRKVEIQISDTGCGIKKEHRTRMFDPLFTTKKVGEGTGLGLFVSYGIIAKHGGTITFETKTEEESSAPGTTFFIILPAVHTHAVP